MTTRVLLNRHRHELHEILVRHGVNPALSRWTNERKGWTSDTPETLEVGLCHFLFNPDNDGTLSVHFKPTNDGGGSVGLVRLSWTDALSLFDGWAARVKVELSHEDPWQRYAAYVPPERLGGSTDNSPFSQREAEHVANSVESFADHVRKHLPNYREVANQFDPQFERLATQAKKGAGRIDWSNQFVGMLISLCIALSLDPDAAAALWKYWVQVVDTILLS